MYSLMVGCMPGSWSLESGRISGWMNWGDVISWNFECFICTGTPAKHSQCHTICHRTPYISCLTRYVSWLVMVKVIPVSSVLLPQFFQVPTIFAPGLFCHRPECFQFCLVIFIGLIYNVIELFILTIPMTFVFSLASLSLFFFSPFHIFVILESPSWSEWCMHMSLSLG